MTDTPAALPRRRSLLDYPAANALAVAVARFEASASGLPGLYNGPADAYRHVVWTAEMASRFGPDSAGRYAELHEMTAALSASAAERRGLPVDISDSPEGRGMDRRNNLLGIAIGSRARTFDEVVAMSREVMDRSPRDGSGGALGAVWLPPRTWAGGPSISDGNWPLTDWAKVPPQHRQRYRQGGEAYRHPILRHGTDHRRAAAERRAAIAAETRAAWDALLRLDEAGDADLGPGGPVRVDAHLRDGHPVRAHTRSAPAH